MNALRKHSAKAVVVAAIVIGASLAALATPRLTYAFGASTPFGGRISSVRFCLNGAILMRLSPAYGPSKVVWTPSTKTYDYGPPSHPGQWILGLVGTEYPCVLGPHQVDYGTQIDMEGNSI